MVSQDGLVYMHSSFRVTYPRRAERLRKGIGSKLVHKLEGKGKIFDFLKSGSV